MNINDLLSTNTNDAISTDLEAAMLANAQNYAKIQIPPAVAAAQKLSEDAFLYGRNGEYLDLQRVAEATKETIGRWHYNGNVGNDPGNIGSGNPTATYTWTPGDTAILTAKGSLLGQANVYFYMPLELTLALPRRIVDHRIHQIADPRPWRAPEFQWQQIRNGALHNGAIQFNLLTKKLRYFVYGGTWLEFANQPPFPDFSKPVETYTEYALDAKSTTHVAITINGSRYELGVTNQTFAKAVADKFTIAVQIDPLKDGNCTLAISACDLRTL